MSKAEQGGSGERLEQHIDVPEEVNRKSSPYFRVSFVCRAEVLREVCSEGHRLVVWPPLLLGALLSWIFSLASDPQQTVNSPGEGCFLFSFFYFFPELGLCSYMQAFCSCGEWGLLSSRSPRAS